MIVSIIIPAKNAELTIGPLLESLLIQRYRPLEIIVIEGGSSDGTRSIIAKYVPKAADTGINLRLLDETRFSGPLGPAHARNIGITQAKGENILFLDADFMLLRENDIEKTVEELKKHPAVSAKVKPLIDSWIEEQVALDGYNPKYKTNVHCFFAIHRESFKGLCFDENLVFGEDYDLFNRCCIEPTLIDVVIGRHFPSSLAEYISEVRWYGRTSLPFMMKNSSYLKLMLQTFVGYMFPLILLFTFAITLMIGEIEISIVSLSLYLIFTMAQLVLSPKKTPSRLFYLVLIKPLFKLFFFTLGFTENLIQKD